LTKLSPDQCLLNAVVLFQVAFGQDWFCFFDLAYQQMMHTQNYSMMAYLSYTFVMTHFLFSTFQKSRVSYPTTATEKRNLQQKSENIIETLQAEMSPTSRAFNPLSLLVRLLTITNLDFEHKLISIFTNTVRVLFKTTNACNCFFVKYIYGNNVTKCLHGIFLLLGNAHKKARCNYLSSIVHFLH